MNLEIQRLLENKDQENVMMQIMDRYGREIVWLAYSYVKDSATAEDLAQDVFIKCYEKLPEFRAESSLKTWLFRVTINRCKDYLKSASFRRIIPSVIEEHLFKRNVSSPEKMAIERDESSILTERVLSLPPKYREVIILHYFEELKTKEVAQLLREKEGTIKTRLRKARNLLRAEYETDEEGKSPWIGN